MAVLVKLLVRRGSIPNEYIALLPNKFSYELWPIAIGQIYKGVFRFRTLTIVEDETSSRL